MNYASSYENTIELIKILHEGQFDKIGEAYVNHPIRVSKNMLKIDSTASLDVLQAALLHDVIEDCDISSSDLVEKGFSERTILLVNGLTKDKSIKKSYDEVIDDIIASDDKDLIALKMADNMDNMNPRRLQKVRDDNPETADRLESKYQSSFNKLKNAYELWHTLRISTT